MDAHGVIHHLCNLEPRNDGDPETVLGLIRVTPMNRSAIAKACSTPRKTIRNVLKPFEEVGFVARGDAGLQVTGAGAAFLHAFERTLTSLTREELEFLSATPNRGLVLQRLRAGPAWKNELAADARLPSRTTIQRIIAELTERGWTTRDPGDRWEITESGTEVLGAYEDFLVATEQSISKAPVLRGLGELSATLPLEALVDAELLEESPGNPHVLLQASLDLAGIDEEPVSRINAIVPIFSTILYDEYLRLVNRGTRFRVVFDRKTARRFRETDGLAYLDFATNALSAEVRFYPESLDFGTAIYDDTAMVAAYPDGGGHPAAVISRHPEFVAWVTGLIDEYWELSSTAPDYAGAASGRETDV